MHFMNGIYKLSRMIPAVAWIYLLAYISEEWSYILYPVTVWWQAPTLVLFWIFSFIIFTSLVEYFVQGLNVNKMLGGEGDRED